MLRRVVVPSACTDFLSQVHSASCTNELDIAFNDFSESFLDWGVFDSGNKQKFEFDKLAGWICKGLGWTMHDRFICMQFNFQHYYYPCHTDGCGFLKPKLMGGDGFGDQIAVLQLRGGETSVFIAGEAPNGKWLAVQFTV